MDERRARIHDDLRGVIEGELLFEPLERANYAHDASIYEIDPLGVIVPRTEQDVATAVRYAAENQIAVQARGAGTDPSGGVLGAGLVIDFSRHFRRIVSIAADSVVVQPGVVLDHLNAQLAPMGRRIGPDPAGSEFCTIGGMIGVDAVGPRSLRWGSTGDYVAHLRVVFAHGEVAEVGYEPWPEYDDDAIDFKGVVVRKLGALARHNSEMLSRRIARAPRSRAGYALGRSATPSGIDLARLLVGSEGTLALVTEATLRTIPIPAAQGVALLPFARLSDAAMAVAKCLEESPSACDLYDWRSLHLVRDAVPAFRDWIPELAESVLIVEFEGDDPNEVADRLRRLTNRMIRSRLLVADPVEFTRRAEAERVLNLRRVVEPLLMRMKGPARPIPFIEDVAVPPAALAEFLHQLQNIFKHHDVSWTLDAQAGLGLLRIRPFLDIADPSDLAKIEPLATQVVDAALDLGGAISGAHGCGLVRTQFLRRQFGDQVQLFREIKDAFDPLNVLNPGKVIGDDPHLITRNIKRMPVPVPEPEPDEDAEAETGTAATSWILPVLRWTDRSPMETASACNGCGACRTSDPSARMCPTFRALGSEAATPRSKANLIRQMMAGAIDPKLWGTEELRQNADLCIHCNLCSKECPSGLDVSTLMLEAKAAYAENHGLPPVDWMLSRVDLWSRVASRFPIISNALLSNGTTRWLFERLFGLAKLRRLPKVHRTPFVRRAARQGLTRPRPQAPGPRVLYFVDVYANYFDQELAEAAVAVLHQAEVNVYVPTAQRGSGMPALVAGDIDHARDLALANLRVLGNAVRDGYTIVCSEPTATLMLRHEYLKLTDDLDAALVAANTFDLGQYLAGLEARGQLPAPKHPLRARVGYHQPCHLRALDVGTPGLDLIRNIPELDVEFIDRGCSGMAGTFGLARDHFRTSLRAGRPLLNRLRDVDIEIGSTECGACRMQMEQGAPKRTLHPIKLLSMSYGLNPALLRQFKAPKARHEVL
ncbi:FAD/FMN-containing dehydrogenase [Singulisphaera sp. GP187]|uniref:FAD-binding oxidoreductase n=1 Tax=Singulisphaera sp. GP187 TaxID=1882752 RepID=UPI000929EA95|nr:FAD-binding oxidoreductase [Singulisphaera sp. GP187]SIO59703.1 FAD/FMN-containing dehydrogenase [Singulisphaera sp. GP187]